MLIYDLVAFFPDSIYHSTADYMFWLSSILPGLQTVITIRRHALSPVPSRNLRGPGQNFLRGTQGHHDLQTSETKLRSRGPVFPKGSLLARGLLHQPQGSLLNFRLALKLGAIIRFGARGKLPSLSPSPSRRPWLLQAWTGSYPFYNEYNASTFMQLLSIFFNILVFHPSRIIFQHPTG